MQNETEKRQKAAIAAIHNAYGAQEDESGEVDEISMVS